MKIYNHKNKGFLKKDVLKILFSFLTPEIQYLFLSKKKELRIGQNPKNLTYSK
jgi:hypothetical protein